MHNILCCSSQFYIILNLAVGGEYFGDDLSNEPYARPWTLSSGKAMRQFWQSRAMWRPTWQGENAALQVDYLRVYEY